MLSLQVLQRTNLCKIRDDDIIMFVFDLKGRDVLYPELSIRQNEYGFLLMLHEEFPMVAFDAEGKMFAIWDDPSRIAFAEYRHFALIRAMWLGRE